MTATADTATRQNRAGGPCPPWCDRDHDDSSGGAAHIRQTGIISFGDEGLDSIWASAILDAHHEGRPVVAVTSHRYQQHGAPYLEVPAGHRARDLAGMIELLADLTPGQHRELAAAIRKAAAVIAEARGDARLDAPYDF